MSLDSSITEKLVSQYLGTTFPAAQIEIVHRGVTNYSRGFGFLDPETHRHRTDSQTRFDLASVTKLFVVTAFITLVEQNRVALDQPVCEVLPEFSGARPIAPYPDPLRPGMFVEIAAGAQSKVNACTRVGASASAQEVTFRHLLTHTSGLPAWLPLWKMNSRAGMRDAALCTAFAYPIGAHTIYSDLGLIILGWAIEKLTNQNLDQVVREKVAQPLGLSSLEYGPLPCENIAPTEFYAHHDKRMCGEVHDENAFGLGGVAGHSGLFAHARDVATFGEMYRRGGAPVLKTETVTEMTCLQAQDGSTRRGLGFALWSPDPEASGNPFSEQAFGHTGFTGTSLWVDPSRALVVAVLTNRVYYGRGNANQIAQFRVALHRAICKMIDE